VQISWKSHVFFPLSWGRWPSLIRRNRLQVWAVIHDYQGEGASGSRKCQWWKDCPSAWAQLSTENVNFCTRSRPYQREASRPSGPGQVFDFFSQPLTPRDTYEVAYMWHDHRELGLTNYGRGTYVQHDSRTHELWNRCLMRNVAHGERRSKM